jgi:LuxR family transcriptional regulator, quorum-sensing system regulator BjaR1
MPKDQGRAFKQFHPLIAASRTVAECTAIFLKFLRPYQIETFACGEVDIAAKVRNTFFVIEWPKRFRDFYVKSGLVTRDPVVNSLEWYSNPFTWQELRADRRISILGTEALDKIRANGWADGLAVPIPRGGTRYGLVSLVAERRSTIDPDTKAILSLHSVCFHERVRSMAPVEGFPVPPAGLTDRERQCLSLIARGLSDREIGSELGIAAPTAHEHFENAKRKLLVRTRAHAVAVAVSLGIIAV